MGCSSAGVHLGEHFGNALLVDGVRGQSEQDERVGERY